MNTGKNFTYEPTDNPDLFRFLNRNGDWTHYWIESLNLYLPAVNHILDVGFNKGPGFMQYLLNTNREEAKKKLETAGEEGTRIHQAIRDLIDGIAVTAETKYLNELTGRQEVLNADEWDCLIAFVQWVNDFKPQTIRNEFAVFNVFSNYAGTADWLGSVEITEKKVVKRINVLIDWKSSGAIYGNYALQVAAYRNSIPETASDTSGGLKSSPRGKQVAKQVVHGVYTAILRLGTRHKCGYEFKLWTPAESDANFGRFLAVRDLFEYTEGEFKPEIVDIPLELKVEIPKHKEQAKASNRKPKQAPIKKVNKVKSNVKKSNVRISI